MNDFVAATPRGRTARPRVGGYRLASIGSHNFGNRSFRLNFEMAAVVYDEAFTREVADMFERDLASSRRIRPEDYRDRPWHWRFGVRLARLMAPIL